MYKRETEMTWDPSIDSMGTMSWETARYLENYIAVASVERLGRIQGSARSKKDFDKSGSVSGVVGS